MVSELAITRIPDVLTGVFQRPVEIPRQMISEPTVGICEVHIRPFEHSYISSAQIFQILWSEGQTIISYFPVRVIAVFVTRHGIVEVRPFNNPF